MQDHCGTTELVMEDPALRVAQHYAATREVVSEKRQGVSHAKI